MKIRILILLVVILVAALTVVPALAKPTLVIGEISSIDGNRITLLTKKNQTVTVISPDEFDMSTLLVGDWIIAKSQMQGDQLMADWVKRIGKKSTENEDKPEGKKDNSAYCAADKKQDLHPMAMSLAEKFEADPEWIMDNFCDGYGMGAIMLALKTQQISGVEADELLAKRADGQGWGMIWKELKMIGNEREAKTPPGWLKKP